MGVGGGDRLPWWLTGKESAYNAGHMGSIPGSGRSAGIGNSNPLQYSCLEKSHEQRSLVGDTAKEWDWTEHPHRQQMEIQR